MAFPVKPSVKTIWATDPGAIVEPVPSKKLTGFVVEKPAYQTWNWLTNNLSLWERYAEDFTDVLATAIQIDSGFVGIGVTPTVHLDIFSDSQDTIARIRNRSAVARDAILIIDRNDDIGKSHIEFATNGVVDKYLGLLRNGGSPTSRWAISDGIDLAVTIPDFIVSPAGDIGLGIKDPLSKLHIVKETGATQLRIETNDPGDASVSILFIGKDGGVDKIGTTGFNPTTDTYFFGYDSSVSSVLGFNIDPSGNVGLGVAQALSKYHIDAPSGFETSRLSSVGNIGQKFVSSYSADDDLSLVTQYISTQDGVGNAWFFGRFASSATDQVFGLGFGLVDTGTTDEAVLIINKNKEVGINTLSPGANLDVNGTFDNGNRNFRISGLTDADDEFILAHTFLGTRGGSILVEPGTYEMSDVVAISNNNIKIQGSGSGSSGTILEAQAGLSAENMFTVSGDDCLFENIELSGSATGIGIYLIDITGTGKVTLRNCTLTRGGLSGIRIQSGGILVIENCNIEVDDDANDMGIDAESGSFVTVVGCEIDAASAGVGIGMRSLTDDALISRSKLSNLDEGLRMHHGKILDNNFFNCDNGIKPVTGTDVDNLKISRNEFLSCNTWGIFMDNSIANNVDIRDNDFIEQAGGGMIDIRRPAVVSITGNNSNNCTSGKGFTIGAGLLHSLPMNIKVDGNNFSDFDSATTVIKLDLSAPSGTGFGKGRSVSVSNNNFSNISVSGINLEIINIESGGPAVVSNNTMMHFHSQDFVSGSLAITAIRVSDNHCNINGNNIFTDNLHNSGMEVIGIQAFGIRSTLNGNVIKLGTDSTQDTTGIESSSENMIMSGNMLTVTNSGAGAGNAFNHSATEGVAVGNDYSTSDALGTLTISSGIVANNNA